MRRNLIFVTACGSAIATVTLSGGDHISFSGFDAPAFLIGAQHPGLQDALLSGDPLTQFNATFLGKEATHTNQFLVNGVSVFNNLSAPGPTYGSFAADGPMNFSFLDAAAYEKRQTAASRGPL